MERLNIEGWNSQWRRMEDFSPATRCSVSKNVSFIKITPIEVFVEKHMEKFRAEKL